MTLFKQIALMLSILLLVILTTVLTLEFKSANIAVQERLYEDAKNTATSLSLSLGSANGDISMMSTIINANFDSGHYLEIKLVDVDNIVLYERRNESELTDVPKWFLDFVDITAPIASANVSAGWSQVGILSVQSDDSYSSTYLYTVFKELLMSFSIIALVGLIILNFLLHAILKPLNNIQKQAEAIIRNEFIIQDKIPSIKEFRDVVVGMNKMVTKVKAMFDKGNQELKMQKELEYIDQVTFLRNRKYLVDRLPEYLKVDASSKGGVNILISLSGMIQANEKLGHQDVDKLFVDIANIFRTNSKKFKNSIVARLNGTEFSLLLPDCSGDEALEVSNNIYGSAIKLIEDCELNKDETFVSLGLYEYSHKNSIEQLFSNSDNALAQAKFQHNNIYLVKAEDTTEVMGKEAWKMIINQAINKNRFHFVSWSVIDTLTKKLVHNVLSINLSLDKNTSYSYAQFMAPAIQTGMSNNIYKNVVKMMFTKPNVVSENLTYSFRLPYEYLEMKDTYNELSDLLRVNASTLGFKLIIEMPDRLVRQNSQLISLYKKLFDEYNIEIGIFEFIGDSDDYKYLQLLRPLYIKGEADYFLTQSAQSLSALRLITDSVSIDLIAVGVMDMQTVDELNKIEVHIVQGRATELFV